MGSVKGKINREMLHELYLKHTDKEIASMFGVVEEAIAHWRKKWDIPTFSQRQRRDLARENLPRLEELTPAKLKELYNQGDKENE